MDGWKDMDEETQREVGCLPGQPARERWTVGGLMQSNRKPKGAEIFIVR